ncbi:ATP-binding protein [Streptomyces sp. M41]|uniref:ATP-binding protein n=1 Tax=Streptomyces sp. M41 TaxID=3059412 RepID=UPI00374DF1BE
MNVATRSRRKECTRLQITAPNADPASVHALRHRLEATLHCWGLETVAQTAALLASEVLTNAVAHARGGLHSGTPAVRMTVSHRGGTLVVEVGDTSVRLPRMRQAADEDENGRGMLLLQALADKWGAESVRGGKKVWFTLRVPRS